MLTLQLVTESQLSQLLKRRVKSALTFPDIKTHCKAIMTKTVIKNVQIGQQNRIESSDTDSLYMSEFNIGQRCYHKLEKG